MLFGERGGENNDNVALLAKLLKSVTLGCTELFAPLVGGNAVEKGGVNIK